MKSRLRSRTSAALVALGSGVAVTLVAAAAIDRHARRRVPQDGRLLTIEGRRLHVHSIGEGPPIVLIHGLGGQMRNFSYALTERLHHRHRLVLIDRPGSGYSQAAGSGASLRAQAHVIAEAIRQMRIVRPLIVGHSLGGAVALSLALDNPGLAGGLALIAPLTQAPRVPSWIASPILRSRWPQHLIAAAVSPPLLVARNAGLMRKAFAPESVPADFPIKGGGNLTRAPFTLAGMLRDARSLEHDVATMATRYRDLNIPTSILFGDDDRILPPGRHGRRTAEEIADARLTIIPGGHMLPVTQPDAVAEWIVEAQSRIRNHADRS